MFDPRLIGSRIMDDYYRLESAVTQACHLEQNEYITNIDHCKITGVFTATVVHGDCVDTIQVDSLTVEQILREDNDN
ncbi:hypothetical protein VPHF86_0194 [Vibrio phage F86]